METDWSSLHKLLGEPTRRSILELLAQKEEGLTYTEIMTVLGIANTGRLNYHLKAIANLVTKDEQGKYHLTEQGKLAANLLKTFPERVPPSERKPSALKITVAVVLILVGILLVASFALAILSIPTTVATTGSESASVSSQIIPQNLSVSLVNWHYTGTNLRISWSANGPIYIYVLNQSQYDTLLLQHSNSAGQNYVENFTGAPTSWVQHYHVQSDNVSLALQQGQYYFFASCNSSVVLNSFQISQQQTPQQAPARFQISPAFYLQLSIFLGLGAVLIVLGLSILTKRVWR